MSLILARVAAAHRVAAVSSYVSVIMADGPLGYWRLGEVSGAVVADSSGNGYTGTAVNCTRGAAALINNNGGDLATQGDGTSSQITVGAVPSLYGLNRSFSIEAWLKPAFNSSSSGIWSSGASGFCMRRNTDKIEILKDYIASLGTFAVGLAAGVRYHVVGVVDASGTFTLYVNGTAAGTISVSTQTFGGSFVRIGADGSNAATVGTFLDGVIDEVAVYNKVLTAAQVLAHYRAGA